MLTKRFKQLLFIITFLLIIVVAILAGSLPYSRTQHFALEFSEPPIRAFILHNVTLVDVENKNTQLDSALLISDGMISAIGSLQQLAKQYPDILLIDGNAQFVTHGLIDAHVHVFDPHDLALHLSHGITAVRSMAGTPAQLRWQQQQTQALLGARLMVMSPALNAGDDMGPFHIDVDEEDNLSDLVSRLHQQGYQGLKIYSGLQPDTVTKIIKQADTLGIPVAGHPNKTIARTDQAQPQLASIEHIEELFQINLNYQATQASVSQLAQSLLAQNQIVVGTLVAYDQIYQASQNYEAFYQTVNHDYLNSFVSFVGHRQLSDYRHSTPDSGGFTYEAKKQRALIGITRVLHEHGVTFAVGTDTGPALTQPGLSFHRELELLAQAGLSNADILKAATIHGAQLLNDPLMDGRIQVDRRADLILTAENPLVNLATLKEPTAIIFNGQLLSGPTVTSIRQQGQQHFSFFAQLGWLVEAKFN
ncbi:MAG: amidohydrolase family protein [Gammaproteobacteria bacterium]|nr:amidohydrolase family protein [Gammaproteobacteria bacterium]